MGFKLIRLDTEESTKIPLTVGTHVIGRGSFLNCDDHRVSRQHGVIKVTDNSVALKSLHQNPCFYNKLNLHKTTVLSQGKWVSLSNSDHFGLLPDTYWYELIFCDDDTSYSTITEQTEQQNRINTTEKAAGTVTQYKNRSILTTEVKETLRTKSDDVDSVTQQYSNEIECDEDSGSEILNLEFDEIMEDSKEPQSLLTTDNTVPVDINMSKLSNKQTNSHETDIQTTPGKRPHTPEPGPDAKKVKTEPESPKNTERPKDPIIEEPHSDTGPQSSMEADIEPQNSSDVNSELESSGDAITDADSATDLNTEPQSPSNADVKKEPQNPDNAIDVKKEPLSPEDVKKQPDVNKPGSSHDQQGSSNDDGSAAAKPPNQPTRERCIYGANCYRKNPQHKLQFSHPSDSDYGAGARGQCPYGAACRRTDPRHWLHHEHPPGTAPRPRPQGMRVVERHGQIFYINAHTVHFHDDHYEVEDEDGDSVDFDYEF